MSTELAELGLDARPDAPPHSREHRETLDKALAAMKNLFHWLRTDHPLVFVCCVALPGFLLVLGLLALFGVL